MGRALRVACGLALVGLFLVAWRGQWNWQFASSRGAGQLAVAVAAMFALWLLVTGRGMTPSGVTAAPRRAWVVAAALCVLGVVLRLVHFSSVPGGMNHDAAFNGMYALHVLEGGRYTPYVSAAWGRETLFMYLCTPLVAWLGNTPEAIQLAATLVGIATLPLFYAFARAVLGARIALVALGFLAVSGWHGVFSRVGWRMITVPPFEMIALLGLWRALHTDAIRHWLLAGAGAALSIYTYDAGRVVPLMLAAVLAIWTLRAPASWRRWARGSVLALLAFLVVGAPMLLYAATHFEQFKARATHLATTERRAGIGATLIAAAGLFNYRGNGNDFFIDEPLLEPVAGALFVFGVLLAVRRWREPAMTFILVGLASGLLPGMLAVPNGNRCIAALPFVYCLIGLAAETLATTVAALLAPRRAGVVAIACLAALITAAAVETYREYLGPTRRRILGFSPEATAAGEYLRRFGDGYTRYVVAESWPEYTLAYLSYAGGGTPLENHYALGRRFDDIEPRINRYGRNGLVFVTDLKPAGRDALERLQRMFPEHRLEPVVAVRQGGRPVGAAFVVEPRAAQATAAEAPAGNAFDGGRGDAPGRFREPIGIAIAPNGDLYVADKGNHRVQQFRSDGTFVRTWGHEGNGPGEFREPHDVAVDGDLVYVADLWNQRVQVFTLDGTFRSAITGAPSLASPRGLFARDGLIYVVEAGAGRVTVYDRDGVLRQTFGGTRGGGAPGHLVEPVDAVVDAHGDLWVINSGWNRLERFASDGTPIGALPIPGWTGSRLKEVSLALDDEGTFHLGDWDRGVVRRFRPDGTELEPLGAAIRQPSGIAVAPDRVLVVTRADDAVRVLKP